MRWLLILLLAVASTGRAHAISCKDFDELRTRANSDQLYESYFRGWAGGFSGAMISAYTFSLKNPEGALYCPARYDDGLSLDNFIRHYETQKAKYPTVKAQDCLAENMIVLGLKEQFPCR